MSASYKKLWKLLIDRDMKKSDLIKQPKTPEIQYNRNQTS